MQHTSQLFKSLRTNADSPLKSKSGNAQAVSGPGVSSSRVLRFMRNPEPSSAGARGGDKDDTHAPALSRIECIPQRGDLVVPTDERRSMEITLRSHSHSDASA